MTKEKLNHLDDIRSRIDRGEEYLALAQHQENNRGRINCLLGNAPWLVHEDTLENVWVLMERDAEFHLAQMKKEFEEA